MGRFDILREIERLDPVTDHQRIVHLSFGYEFPRDSPGAGDRAVSHLLRPQHFCAAGRSDDYVVWISETAAADPPAVEVTLKLRGRAVRWLPRGRPRTSSDNRNRRHPDGYDIARLGPPKLVPAEEKRAKS